MKWRFEKKFDLRELQRFQIEQIVKNHPYSFSQIYYPRWINSIYFDTFDLKNYQENIMGIGHRTKYRVRWYGDVTIDQVADGPILEKKIKKGLIGIKEKNSLGKIESKDVQAALNLSSIPEEMRSEVCQLKPKVLIKYYRSYFQSFDGKFILTVDTDIQVSDVRQQKYRKPWALNQSVLELKYDHDTDCPQNVGAALPFRQSRFSKYVKGIDLLRDYGL